LSRGHLRHHLRLHRHPLHPRLRHQPSLHHLLRDLQMRLQRHHPRACASMTAFLLQMANAMTVGRGLSSLNAIEAQTAKIAIAVTLRPRHRLVHPHRLPQIAPPSLA
jgi:hypothetical protein